jgi:hypothetical protein
VRRAQLGESVANTLRRLRVLDRVSEHVNNVIVSPEVGEVFERQVDRPCHRAGAAQLTKFVELSLSARHAVRLRRFADRPLYRG